MGTGATEFKDQVGDDDDIDNEENNLEGSCVAEDFIDLERNKRDRDNDCEILCPALPESEPHSFEQRYSGVDEGTDAQLLKAMIVDIGETLQQMMDEVISGINADYVHPVINDGFHVMMKKFQNAESGGEEQ